MEGMLTLFDRTTRSRAIGPEDAGVVARATRLVTVLAASLLGLAVTAGAVGAQEAETEERLDRLEAQVERLQERLAEQDTGEVAEVRRQLETVLREIEQLRLGQELVTVADSGMFGLAPAASKVYRVQEGVSVGGYGEVLYENFASEREDGTPSGATDQIDALRAIVYLGYKFNDKLLFNSEIEFEHGSTSGGAGSASVEFAYLDYRVSDQLGFRAGMLLPPMGFLNELHEPPTFLGSERPITEQALIPSTWRENGIGIFGATGDLDYRLYLVNGLDGVGAGASPASGFSAAGLRGGRQKGAKAVAEDFGLVGRVDYTGTLGLLVGSSLYVGESGQNNPSPSEAGETIGARTLIWEGHAQYRAQGLDLRGLVALGDVSDVTELNAIHDYEGSESIGERLVGGYAQVGYDVLRNAPTDHHLMPYIRYETLNTQDEVPEGFSANPANDRTVVSLGAAWRPVPQAILKADYQIHSTEADTGVDQFNVALGWLF